MLAGSMQHFGQLLTFLCSALLLTACSQEKPRVLLRISGTVGTVNEYTLLYIGETQVYEHDSLVSDRSSRISIDAWEEVTGKPDDTLIELRLRQVYHSQTNDRVKGTSTDTSFSWDDVILTMSPRGSLVDLRYAEKPADPELTYTRRFMEQYWPVYPREPIPVGSGWEQQAEVAGVDSPMVASTIYRFDSLVVRDTFPCAVLHYTGTLILPVSADTTAAEPIRGVNRITTRGTLLYAYKHGLTILQTEERLVEGEREKWRDSVWIPTRYRAHFTVENRLVSSKPGKN